MATVREIFENVLEHGPLPIDEIATNAGARRADARGVLDRLVSAGALESIRGDFWDAPSEDQTGDRESRAELAWRRARMSGIDLDAAV